MEMKELKKYSDAQRIFEYGPFRPFPNCKEFKVDIKKYNKLFLEHGVKLRESPTM